MFYPPASHTIHVQHLVGFVAKMSCVNSRALPRPELFQSHALHEH